MGNRVLSESIKRSAEIDQLTWFQEVVFIRLILTADDYGRYHANPIILRNDLFPTKEDVTKKSITEALDRMEDLNLIQRYNSDDGNEYLQLVTWAKHQNIRNMKSKFPNPPPRTEKQTQTIENNCKQLKSIENNCSSNPIQSESNPNPNPHPNPTRAPARETDDVDDAMYTDNALLRTQEEHNAIFSAWESGGFQTNDYIRKALVDYYAAHGKDRLLEAITITAQSSPQKPLQYLKAILDNPGSKKKPVTTCCIPPRTNPAANFPQRDWSNEDDSMEAFMATMREKDAKKKPERTETA